jgi:hypothetical protein
MRERHNATAPVSIHRPDKPPAVAERRCGSRVPMTDED